DRRGVARRGDRVGRQDPVRGARRLDRDPPAGADAGRRAVGAVGPPPIDAVDRIFREEWGRAVAALARATGDLGLAEDALQDAFETALERWPRSGLPPNPGGWIVTTARNRAVDRIRRDRTLAHKTELLSRLAASIPEDADAVTDVPDER